MTLLGFRVEPVLRALSEANFKRYCDEVQQAVDAELQQYKEHLKAQSETLLAEQLKELEEQRRKLETREKKLEFQTAEVQTREQELDLEKQCMMGKNRTDDVLHINIAGQQRCQILRSTMCAVQGSMLAAHFSGRWDDGLKRDDQGLIFIDYSERIFVPLLDCLRQKVRETSKERATLPSVSDGHWDAFVSMARHYGVLEAVCPASMKVYGGSRLSAVQLHRESGHVNTHGIWATVGLYGKTGCEEYSVTVGEIDNPQVGWATIKARPEPDSLGTGDDPESWAIDGKRHCYWHNSLKTPAEIRWEAGATVRCVLDRVECAMRWFVNGQEVYANEAPVVEHAVLHPMVTGTGTWTFTSYRQ